MPIQLGTPIQYLKGVGDKRAALYHKLNIHTAGDLLFHYPRNYLDLTSVCDIAAAPAGELCAIRAMVVSKTGEQRIRKGLSLFKVIAEDSTGSVTITFFNNKYLVDKLRLEESYLFYGIVSGGFSLLEMASPQVFAQKEAGKLLPIYPQTAGLASSLMRKNVAQILAELPPLEETLPSAVQQEHSLCSRWQSVQTIHFPKNMADVQSARTRIIFEELLVLSLAMGFLRGQKAAAHATPMRPVNMAEFYRRLPFSPTQAQSRSVKEIAADLCKPTPMNRLLQGDVGSGKTLVAAAAIWMAARNGLQAAMMAPTEILAAQHFRTLSALLAGSGISIALLTGSSKAAEKRAVRSGLADGSIQLCIGTHALLSQEVTFAHLGLVITDEQHRFGVSQRSTLSQKNKDVHVLVMSATPIPRTLSLMLYGELQLSVLDELPPGRQPVATHVINSEKRERAMGFIREHLRQGRQAYIICPLIQQGEVDTGLKPAVEYAEMLRTGSLKGFSVGLLHGKMKPAEKDETMARFAAGEIQALVSTTVVEVGVDVPNACIILIENAERFGLSQLHQLRGRVGRGGHSSHCILLSDARGETAKKRLQVMRHSSNGFEIAEYDLKLRGPGDFFGQRQHGLPEMKLASLADNVDLLQQAQSSAQALLQQDALLQAAQHQLLRQAVEQMLHAVGERPN